MDLRRSDQTLSTILGGTWAGTETITGWAQGGQKGRLVWRRASVCVCVCACM